MGNNKYYELYQELDKILYKYAKELNLGQKKQFLQLQIDFLENASYNHDSAAQFSLALMYGESGYLNPNPFYDHKKYEMWLKTAVDNGNKEAMPNLANIYLWNNNIQERKIIEGLALLFVAFKHNPEKDGLAFLNYKNILRHLKKKNSELRLLLLKELQNLPDRGKQFLKMHLDYANAIAPYEET